MARNKKEKTVPVCFAIGKTLWTDEEEAKKKKKSILKDLITYSTQRRKVEYQ
jgi:hypothetical protein